MKKETWIEDILESAKQIGNVMPNPYMATRITAKLNAGPSDVALSPRWILVAVAGIILLLTVNISVLQNPTKSSNGDAVQQLIREYGWSSSELYSSSW